MKPLQIFLALWLSMAVPSTALASIVRAGHCSTMNSAAKNPASSHAGHQMQGMDHSEHMQHLASEAPQKSVKSGCKCGCNCSTYHCVSSAAGLMTATHLRNLLVASDGKQRPYADPARTASAHHLDLLRPPSLT